MHGHKVCSKCQTLARRTQARNRMLAIDQMCHQLAIAPSLVTHAFTSICLSLGLRYSDVTFTSNEKLTRWLYCVECPNTVLGEDALLMYIVPVCYVKTGMERASYIIISLQQKKKLNYYKYSTNY